MFTFTVSKISVLVMWDDGKFKSIQKQRQLNWTSNIETPHHILIPTLTTCNVGCQMRNPISGCNAKIDEKIFTKIQKNCLLSSWSSNKQIILNRKTILHHKRQLDRCNILCIKKQNHFAAVALNNSQHTLSSCGFLVNRSSQ